MTSTRKRILFTALAALLAGAGAFAWLQLRPERRVHRAIVRARISTANKQYGLALTEYERALRIDPSNDVALCELGFTRLSMEQPDRAEMQFEDCVRLHPKDRRALRGLVSARLLLGKVDLAEGAAKKMLSLQRDHDSLAAMGDVAAARQAYSEALKNFDAAIAEAPDQFAPVEKKVVLLNRLWRYSEARAQLLKFAERPSAREREKALQSLAFWAFREEQYAECLGYLESALKVSPNTELLIQKSAALSYLNRNEQAAETIESVFKSQSNPPPAAFKIRAMCELASNKLNDAWQHAQIAQKSLTNDASLALLLAKIHQQSNREMQAEEEARRALSISPDFGAAQNFLMSLLLNKGQYAQAIQIGSELAKRPRPNGETLRLLARAYLGAQQIDEGGRAFNSLRPGRGSLPLGLNLGSASPVNAGETAEQTIERLNKLSPAERETASVQFLLGQSYLRTQNIRQALAALERSSELDPSRVETQMTLIGLRLALGQSDLAGERLERVVTDHPDHLKALNLLAQLYVQQRKHDKAAGTFEKIVALDPNSQSALPGLIRARIALRDAPALNAFAQQLESSQSQDQRRAGMLAKAAAKTLENDFSAAEQILDEVLRGAPNSPVAAYERAVVHIRTNEPAKAAELLKNISGTPEFSRTQRLDLALAQLLSGKLEDARASATEEHLVSKQTESFNLLIAIALQEGEQPKALAAAAEMQNSAEQKPYTNLIGKPQSAALFKNIALTDFYTRAGRVDWALETLNAAAGQDGDDLDFRILKTFALIRAARQAAAIDELKQVVSREPSRIEFTYMLAALEQQDNRAGDAIAHFKRVLQAQPGNARAMANLGTLLLNTGEHSEAAAYLEKAVKRLPEDILTLNNYVWLLGVELKSPQRALPFAEDLQRFAPHNANALDTAGWIFFLNNSLQKAQEALSYAKLLAPASRDIGAHYDAVHSALGKNEAASKSSVK